MSWRLRRSIILPLTLHYNGALFTFARRRLVDADLLVTESDGLLSLWWCLYSGWLSGYRWSGQRGRRASVWLGHHSLQCHDWDLLLDVCQHSMDGRDVSLYCRYHSSLSNNPTLALRPALAIHVIRYDRIYEAIVVQGYDTLCYVSGAPTRGSSQMFGRRRQLSSSNTPSSSLHSHGILSESFHMSLMCFLLQWFLLLRDVVAAAVFNWCYCLFRYFFLFLCLCFIVSVCLFLYESAALITSVDKSSWISKLGTVSQDTKQLIGFLDVLHRILSLSVCLSVSLSLRFYMRFYLDVQLYKPWQLQTRWLGYCVLMFSRGSVVW